MDMQLGQTVASRESYRQCATGYARASNIRISRRIRDAFCLRLDKDTARVYTGARNIYATFEFAYLSDHPHMCVFRWSQWRLTAIL
jgi:hypothetical protein